MTYSTAGREHPHLWSYAGGGRGVFGRRGSISKTSRAHGSYVIPHTQRGSSITGPGTQRGLINCWVDGWTRGSRW